MKEDEEMNKPVANVAPDSTKGKQCEMLAIGPAIKGVPEVMSQSPKAE